VLPGCRPKRHWLVSFISYDLGYIDLEQRTLQTIDNPFGTRLSAMSQVRSLTNVSGLYTWENGAPGRIRTCDLWIRNPTLYPAELRALARGEHAEFVSSPSDRPPQ
jgi:hypothetical protein